MWPMAGARADESAGGGCWVYLGRVHLYEGNNAAGGGAHGVRSGESRPGATVGSCSTNRGPAGINPSYRVGQAGPDQRSPETDRPVPRLSGPPPPEGVPAAVRRPVGRCTRPQLPGAGPRASDPGPGPRGVYCRAGGHGPPLRDRRPEIRIAPYARPARPGGDVHGAPRRSPPATSAPRCWPSRWFTNLAPPGWPTTGWTTPRGPRRPARRPAGPG